MGKRPKLSWSGLTAELGRREVYPVVVAYAIVAWLLLQIGEVTFTPLGLPEWVMIGLIFIVIAGFPVAVILAWRYDITSSGIFRDRANVYALAEKEYGPSVAVLPFIDLSPEQDQAYFCEGVAEEITNSLVRIRGLRVAARSSAFQYNSEAGDVREIGSELGVNTILEGSVRKSDGVIRITAQLAKVSDGCHLWSRTYDRELQDVFAIQEEIASSIATSLLDTISRRTRKAIRRPRSANVKAYDYYLRGRKHFKLFRRADIEHARDMFRNAVDLDPEFSLAWAGYADCQSFLAMYAERNPEFIEEAHEASKRALQLDPGLAEAHASRGLACLVSRDFDRAEEEFRKAIDKNPYLPRTYHFYGRERFQRGNMKTAAELFRKSADLDPMDYQSRCLRVQVLHGCGEFDQARKEAREAISVVERHMDSFPDDPSALNLGALSLIQVGEEEQALQWLERALQLDPDDPIVLYNAACGFALLGKADTALNYLESALAHGTISLDWMRNDEDLSSIREDPRYARLEGRLARR
jgi:TolB-like protein/Flp pilus assembly protein TadD